ncbi:Metallo-dependent phosphatase-like protein [Endogone sp. FLAS-F59071]|nr:Metallo-dependent phosphatase-like protein [Endogone sp. FLAS-F59071]|eukprot:RUS15459.1 Metallo-dependent phosphatase-like protein [Endogone sp. FLAS-F59071]
MYRKTKTTGFPSVMTIFSAPNYLDVYNNKAAVLKYENNVMNIRQFNKEELGEPSDEVITDVPEVVKPGAGALEDVEVRRQVIKSKILAIGKLSRVFSVLRQESETVAELKNLSGLDKLPVGTLALGAEGIKNAITNFEDARRSDIDNEHLPPTREEKDAQNQAKTKEKIIHAVEEEDVELTQVAEAIVGETQEI